MPVAEPDAAARPVTRIEARALFKPLQDIPVLVVAVSGGPDSMALLYLLARWRAARKSGPALIAVTVDHGLRKDAAREALLVKKTARAWSVPHHTLRWVGEKPHTGLQEAARMARYRLLGACARKLGAAHVLTAHTRDDQAETVLMRLCRGSGLTGLGGMAQEGPGPAEIAPATLLRPLLDIPKARLVATLAQAKVPFVLDPSNDQPRFTRVRLRAMMEALAREGLSAARLSVLARRARRADAALEAAVEDTGQHVLPIGPSAFRFSIHHFVAWPAEIGLRLLGRLIGTVGDEGPVELAKLEALYDQVRTARPLRRTLAGALISVKPPHLLVEKAPARRPRALAQSSDAGSAGWPDDPLTTPQPPSNKRRKER